MIELSSRLTINRITGISITLFMTVLLAACNASPSVRVAPHIDNSQFNQISDKQNSMSVKTNTVDIDLLNDGNKDYSLEDRLQACKAKDGKLSKQGVAGIYMCILSYKDAGKACQDSSDCQGQCETKGTYVDYGIANQTGQCSSNSSPFGCMQTIENGVTQPAICID